MVLVLLYGLSVFLLCVFVPLSKHLNVAGHVMAFITGVGWGFCVTVPYKTEDRVRKNVQLAQTGIYFGTTVIFAICLLLIFVISFDSKCTLGGIQFCTYICFFY
mmetsp:Transcript_53420/g.61229  ORF Transcript_53420/g.61229 Transcript_53420/m.61229 type:complete len:104 (-) Transcript_53420:220-531(-)